MVTKAKTNRTLNILNLFISILVFGTGLILFTQFHVGGEPYHKDWLGIGKGFWLVIHKISAVAFLIGFVAHIQLHWKYIKMVVRRWRVNLSKKIKATTREQLILLIATLIVIGAGFYPWLTMPGATLGIETYHGWIDLHNRVGLILLIGMTIHVIRRWGLMFYTRRNTKRQKTKQQSTLHTENQLAGE